MGNRVQVDQEFKDFKAIALEISAIPLEHQIQAQLDAGLIEVGAASFPVFEQGVFCRANAIFQQGLIEFVYVDLEVILARFELFGKWFKRDYTLSHSVTELQSRMRKLQEDLTKLHERNHQFICRRV